MASEKKRLRNHWLIWTKISLPIGLPLFDDEIRLLISRWQWKQG